MASVEEMVVTNEQKAIIECNRQENRITLGAFKNLTHHFGQMRERENDAGASSRVNLITSRKASMNDEMQERTDKKAWHSHKHMWDVEFRTMDLDLKKVKELYGDKTVVAFDLDRENDINRKINRTVKKLKKSFTKMKNTVTKFNQKLFAKDKNEFVGPGKDFEDITEWRLAERMAIDLTTRLRERQQQLNIIVMKDNKAREYVKANTTGDPELAQLAQIINDDLRRGLEQESEDVQEIVEAVQQIVQMVTQMSMMIVEQGTVVDRIDYNLEVASARTLKGEDAFKKAEDKNKKAGGMAITCVGVLAVANTILAIIIMWKLHDG